MQINISLGRDWDEIKRRKRRKGPAGLAEYLHIVDLFHRKLFKFVDFDYVLRELKQRGWASCKGIYTQKSLSYELLPQLTLRALEDKSAGTVAGIYAAILKLCSLPGKNFLLYVDPVNREIHTIHSFKKFLKYTDIPDSVHIDDIWFDTQKAIPTIAGAVAANLTKQTAPSSRPPQAVPSYTGRQITPPEGKQQPLYTEKSVTQLFGPEDPQPPKEVESSTGLFADKTNPYEKFQLEYSIAIACKDANSVEDGLLWDTLTFFTYAQQDGAADGAQPTVKQIATWFVQAGVSGIGRAIDNSSGGFAAFMRVARGIPEGDGSSNDLWLTTLLKLYAGVFSVSLSDIQNAFNTMRPTQLLRHLLAEAINKVDAAQAEQLDEDKNQTLSVDDLFK